jgi:hypothetical protein
MTTLAGCAYCHDIIVRGADGDEWKRLPERGTATVPADATACRASPDGLHHPPAGYPRWPPGTGKGT